MGSLPAQLRAQGVKADKKLGQHWLVEASAVASIFQAADIQPGDTVVEVGPGPGLLTPGLCRRARRVVAVELDRRIISALEANTAGIDNLEIRQADILKIDPAEFGRYSIVANLPYYVTSAILKHFLESPNRPDRMTVTVQKEVAERIVAAPPKMSVLAVSVQLYGHPEIAALIPRTAFWPAPEVDSAVLRIDQIGRDTKKILNGLPEAAFFKVVRAGFAEKRKQLHNTLARNLELSHQQASRALAQSSIDSSRRAETLTIPEWVRLTQALLTTAA